jgi:ABC-type branched-subunit amino acid transport system substrate-binding protein
MSALQSRSSQYLLRGGIAIALIGTSATLLAACGSPASPGSAGSSDGQAINLGVIGPMTGVRADVGKGMVTGATLALNVINAHGGVLGHHVNLVVQDDAGDPGDAVPAADEEIQSQHVAAIVGPTALTASVVLPLADKANIPDLMWGGGAAFDTDSDTRFFRLSPSDTQQADSMVLYAKDKGWNKVAIAIGNASADQSLLPGLQSAAKKLGMTITSTVTIAIGSTSFRSEIQKLFSGHPQAILSQFDIPSAGVLFGELQQENLLSTPWVASNLWYAGEFFSSVGAKTATGSINIVNPAAAGPGNTAFEAQLEKYEHRSTPNNGEQVMWDATITWALGAEKAGTLQEPQVSQGILAAANGPGTACYDFVSCLALIKAGKAINWDGASSDVNFDKYHNVFGTFDILHYNSNGSVSTIAAITADALKKAISG